MAEIEHLLQLSHPTDVHDLGTHTVSVTHLDLSKTQSKEENSESEKDDNDSGNEKEEPGIQTSKNISKSISELQTLKQKSKSSVAKVKKASKFQKKTAKSKRSKHYHPKKNTTK